MRVILANKEAYIPHLRSVLEGEQGNSALIDQPGLVWYLLVDDNCDEVMGLVYAHQISDVRVYVQVVMVSRHNGRTDRNGAIENVFRHIWDFIPTANKLETTVPVGDKAKARIFTKLGFTREGVCKASIRINGSLEDQTYFGLVRT